MQPKQISFLVFLAFLAAFTAAYLGGVASVPFHPDESTFFFLSGDFEKLIQQPAEMAWQPENKTSAVQRYRTLDAPLGRYLVGLGRALAGLPPLPVDWDWGLTWDENQQAGAMPSERMLLAGRLAVSALAPFSVLLLYLTGRRIASERAAWLAALLLASSALLLLHARRAMSEGIVVFTVTLMMWTLVRAEKRPWMAAVPAALAFCAKHSLAALAPVGLLAVLWQPGRSKGALLKDAFLFAGLFFVVVIALNPFLWAHPVSALQDALANRQDLLQRQVADRPEQEMKSPEVRLVAMLGSLFIVQPMFSETGNYLAETRASEQAYLANPINSLFRSLAAGAVLLLAYLYGHLALILRAARQRPLPRGAILLLAASLLQVAALLVSVSLPFQRYYLPLVPHACLWAAYGIDRLMSIPKTSTR